MQLFDLAYQWTAWIEFALLVQLFLVSAIQPRAIAQGIQTIVAPIQRRYIDGSNPVVIVLLVIFQIGVLAFTLLYAVAALMPNHPMILLQHYLYMFPVILVVYLIKSGLDRCLQATFRYPVHLPTYLSHRNTLWQLSCMILFLYILLVPHLSTMMLWMIPLMTGIIYMGVTIGKLINLFGISIDHVIYITIYIVHAEIVPILVMAAAAYQLLTHTF